MYRLARAGIQVEPRPVTVVIRQIRLLAVEEDLATLEVEVESGTYIRSLAHDLGQRLGCGAHLKELRRTRVGPLSVEQAFRIEKLEELERAGRLSEAILDPSEALCDLPAIQLEEKAAFGMGHGRTLAVDAVAGLPGLASGQPCRMLGPGGAFLGVGVADGEPKMLRPLVVLRAFG